MMTVGERMGRFNGRRLDEHGQTMVEFALALPVLLLILVGTVMFGVALSNYATLTFATNAAAQQLSFSRGPSGDPCNLTATTLQKAAPGLNSSNLKYTIVLNGVTAANNVASPTCSGDQSDLVVSETASVTVTYPCNLQILTYNPAPSCLLTAQTSVIIQ